LPRASRVAACLATWSTLVDTNSIDGVEQRGVTALGACQQVCVDEPTCVAVDFNFDDDSCWLHNDPSALDPVNVYDQPGTNQYRIDRTCPTAEPSTPLPCRVNNHNDYNGLCLLVADTRSNHSQSYNSLTE